MKNEDYFQILGEIQYLSFLVGQWEKERKNRSGIARMIDQSTGYDRKRYNDLARLMRMIMRRKKKIGEDTQGEEELLAEHSKMLKQRKPRKKPKTST